MGSCIGLSRREFLVNSCLFSAGILCGCAANPVTGRSQLMLVSKDQEIAIDRRNSPHQISADYGVIQDKDLAKYISSVGKRVAAKTHRPGMPYRFLCVNAVYVNAYAFPGGTIAATRGIILKLKNEAQLAALFGHELGHVNARHTARQMTKGMLTQAIVGGLAIYAGTKSRVLGDIAGQLGMLGAGVLLASYSRDNEREADALGLSYMVRAGYGTPGFVGLMRMLKELSKRKMNKVELLFSTHPMSEERYNTAVAAVSEEYADFKRAPLFKERFMDNTASLRRIGRGILEMQIGEARMAKKEYQKAEASFKDALKTAKDDYAGLLLLAKSKMAQEKYNEALPVAEAAAGVYPEEAQARHISGIIRINLKRYDEALKDFNRYERLLPGNPNTIFFIGLCHDRMQHIQDAARYYSAYLKVVNQGEKAAYAAGRLKQWGYIR